MSTIVVQDANVFIDLQAGRMLDVAFKLDCEIHTTDAVLDEVEDRMDKHVKAGHLLITKLTGDELAEIALLRTKQPRRISIEDCTLIKLATRLDAVLLTGDANLRFCAEKTKLVVRGTLWILDTLVEAGHMTPRQAGIALQKMLKAGRRLPAEECQARIRRWL